jgi:hypothetical protein
VKLTTPPSNAEIKNVGAIPPIPHIFKAWCLIINNNNNNNNNVYSRQTSKNMEVLAKVGLDPTTTCSQK